MNFLQHVLDRNSNESHFLLILEGNPSDEVVCQIQQGREYREESISEWIAQKVSK